MAKVYQIGDTPQDGNPSQFDVVEQEQKMIDIAKTLFGSRKPEEVELVRNLCESAAVAIRKASHKERLTPEDCKALDWAEDYFASLKKMIDKASL